MTLEEKIKICSTCSKRTFTTKDGLLCGQSGKKPEFVNACYDYDADVKELEKQKVKQEELDKTDDISGFMSFFIYWSIPIGIVLTILGLFTSAPLPAELANSVFLTLYGIAFYALYFYLSIYTIYAFIKKKSDAVFIAKYQLIILFVNNLLTLISGSVGGSFLDQPARIIGSLAWSVIFFCYLTFSEDVNYRFPKENRKLTKRNKIIFILSIVVPVVLYVGAIFEIAKSTYGFTMFSSDKTKIEEICKNTKAELPLQTAEGLYWVDVTCDEQVVEYKYEYAEASYEELQSFGSDAIYKLLTNYQTELVKSQYAKIIKDKIDPLVGLVAENGTYDIRFKYCSPTGEHLYYVTILNHEIVEMAQEGTYTTDHDSYESLVDSYNEILPIEYFQDCILQSCSISNDPTTLHYELKLVNLTMGDLSGLNQKYLKEHMMGLIPYFTDAPGVVARMNNMDISYDFTAECSDWWNSKVLIKAEEYNDLVIQE
jgi:hypothetical protein